MATSGREPSAKRSSTTHSSTNRNQMENHGEYKAKPARTRVPSLIRSNSIARLNKLYRCPETPPPEIRFDLEHSFVLDGKAVSHISNDYSTANPKFGSAIPPYNSQFDRHTQSYFSFFSVPKTLEKTGQGASSESIPGRVYDRFHTKGHAAQYLSLRNKFGSGHSLEDIRGHDLFLSDPKPVVNYNGLFGYRRNTPALRRQPAIGTTTVEHKGIVPFGRFSVIGCGKPYSFNCECKYDKPCRCHNQSRLCPCVKV